jgi:hypothetical protein
MQPVARLGLRARWSVLHRKSKERVKEFDFSLRKENDDRGAALHFLSGQA